MELKTPPPSWKKKHLEFPFWLLEPFLSWTQLSGPLCLWQYLFIWVIWYDMMWKIESKGFTDSRTTPRAMQLTTPSFLLRKGTQGKLWLKAVWKKRRIPLVVTMSRTHIRRLLMLKAVMQYPRKDMLAPNSSTVKTNPNVCAAQKNCHCKTAQMSSDLSYMSWISGLF